MSSSTSKLYLSTLVVLSRRLGCDDESASDDEQAEKILYFYPPSTPLERQLSRVTMIEGLIEFAGKFSPDSIETVLMEKQLWSFYPAEPDVWIVAAVQIAPDDDASGLTMHRADSLGLDAVVKKLYTFVSTFITAGSVNGHIDRDWERIMEVKQLRKRARKLRIRLRQEEQDCESIRRHEELKNSKAAEQESAEEGTIDIDVDGDKGDVQEIGEGNDADRPQSEQPSEDVPDTDATTRDRDPPNGVEGAVQEAADTSVLRVDAGAAGQEEEVVEREEREGEREVDTPEDNGEVDEDMEEEHLGIRAGMMSLSEILKQINETSAEILAAEEGITAMVADGYVISLLKAKLEYFLNWYVRTGELLSPSFITACGGMHYASVPDSALSRLLQIKYRLQDELNERFLGFSVLVNGQLAWHEIPGETEFQTLYEFIRLQEAERVRSLARNSFSPIVPNAPINGERTLSSGQKLTVTDLAIRRLFAPATGKSAGSSSNKLQLFDIKAQEYLESLLLSSGFISSYWQDIDHPSEIFDDSFTRASIDSDILDWTSIGTGIKIWCPRLNPATSIPADKDSRVPRVVLFRHGRFIAITMLSEDLFVGFDEKAEVEGRSASESKHSLFETLMAIKQIYEDSFQSLQSILDDSSKMPVPTVTTKPSSGSNSKQTSAPAVRVFYYNFCGAATKVSSTKAPQLEALRARLMGAMRPETQILKRLQEDSLFFYAASSNIFKQEFEMFSSSEPWGYFESSKDELRAIKLAHDSGYFKFSAFPAFLIRGIEAPYLNALNGLNESLSSDIDKGVHRHRVGKQWCREACTRVSVASGGWVFGRVRGDRRVFLIVEGCATFDELTAVVEDTLHGSLGLILI